MYIQNLLQHLAYSWFQATVYLCQVTQYLLLTKDCVTSPISVTASSWHISGLASAMIVNLSFPDCSHTMPSLKHFSTNKTLPSSQALSSRKLMTSHTYDVTHHAQRSKTSVCYNLLCVVTIISEWRTNHWKGKHKLLSVNKAKRGWSKRSIPP